VVAEHGPSEKSETDTLPQINCHTLTQRRSHLLVGSVGLLNCIIHSNRHMHVHTAMCKLPLCASKRAGCITCLYARCYTVTELSHPTIENKSTWKREFWHNTYTTLCKSTNLWWPTTAREEHPKQMPPHKSDANKTANVVKLMIAGHMKS